MSDAVFKGYGGAGYTHSGGGGLLEPNDFHGMAALLVEAKDGSTEPASARDQRRRAALERLMDPVWGNWLVRRTLTCLEREINGTQPTIPEGCDLASDASASDEEPSARLQEQQFVGAAVSMLPPVT